MKYKTFITQELLKKKFLASNTCYLSIAHTDEIIENYIELLEPVFKKIAKCESGENIDSLLEGPVCHDGFRRLNQKGIKSSSIFNLINSLISLTHKNFEFVPEL